MAKTGRSAIATWLFASLLTAALVVAAAAWWIDRAVRFVPPFYRQSLGDSPAALAAGGDRFERRALDFASALRHAGAWQLRLTGDEVNGWLGATLPAKLPEALPEELDQPRVTFAAGQACLAARQRVAGVSTVVSLSCEVWLTEVPDELAVRLVGCRAGRLPLPLASVRDRLVRAANSAHIAVRWTEEAGYPVAIVRLPQPKPTTGGIVRRVVLTRLQLEGGALVVEGRTEELHPAAENLSSASPATGNPVIETEMASRDTAPPAAQSSRSDAAQR